MKRLLLAASFVAAVSAGAEDDAARYVAFVQEPAGTCVARGGMQWLVKSTHPTRKLRVWLDRTQMGVGTGDRSRSELGPGADPEPLGCSRLPGGGEQQWRLARAAFVD